MSMMLSQKQLEIAEMDDTDFDKSPFVVAVSAAVDPGDAGVGSTGLVRSAEARLRAGYGGGVWFNRTPSCRDAFTSTSY